MKSAAKKNKNTAAVSSIDAEYPHLNDKPIIPKAMDVPTLVSQHTAKNIAVANGEATFSMSRGEAQVEKMFRDAINGDPGAMKVLVNWAIKYVPAFTMPKVDGEFFTRWFSNSDVERWKKTGCLPSDAPDDIMKISAGNLNKALKKERELIEKKHQEYAALDAGEEHEFSEGD